MVKSFVLSSFVVLIAGSGCSFAARSAEMYRADTQALLATKNPDVKACYDAALKAKPDLSGTVTVHFKVEKDTGRIVEPAAVPAQTTAPTGLAQCVVQAINGLALQPPDQRDGDATFVYQFTVGQPAGAPPAPPAPPTG